MDKLKAFRKLFQADKQEVIQESLLNKVHETIVAEIINYFKQLNVGE